MTITTTSTVEKYVGDGSQNTWPITFPFFDSEDIKACIVNSSGEQVDLTYGTDYTVTKSTGSIGGTLYYTLADNIVLTIWLSLPITQETDFYNTGPLNAETLEDGFDRLTLIAQQLQEESDRSIKVATSSSETPEELLADLYAGRDAAVASASAAASSEASAAASATLAQTTVNNALSDIEAAKDTAVSEASSSISNLEDSAVTSAQNRIDEYTDGKLEEFYTDASEYVAEIEGAVATAINAADRAEERSQAVPVGLSLAEMAIGANNGHLTFTVHQCDFDTADAYVDEQGNLILQLIGSENDTENDTESDVESEGDE